MRCGAARCGEVLGTRGEKAATGSKEGCWLDGGTATGGAPLRLVQRRKLTGQGWQVDVAPLHSGTAALLARLPYCSTHE